MRRRSSPTVAPDRELMIRTFANGLRTRDEISYAWDCLRRQGSAIDSRALINFQLGEEVTFQGKRDNGMVTGLIEGIGAKNLKVRATGYSLFGAVGVIWTVSPSLLTKTEREKKRERA